MLGLRPLMKPQRRARAPSLLIRRLFVLVVFLATILLVLLAASTEWLTSFGAPPEGARLERMQRNPRFFNGAFTNTRDVTTMSDDVGTWALLKEYVFGDAQRSPDRALPVVDPTTTWSTAPQSGLRVTWLGHSTTLIEIDGARILTDPMFSHRASPSTLVGPARFQPPPVRFADLPGLDAVLISHDHYDHLDMATVRALSAKGLTFYVPLGVGAHLEAWGVPVEQVVELEWWQSAELPDRPIRLHATPAQHFSGRAIHDENVTLWSSWVLEGPEHRVFFSGDTGRAPEFPEVGERLGPFDLVMLEVGAFHRAWGAIHLGPEQAVEVHAELGGGALMPIHWGTFNLALHGWDEPLEVLLRIAQERSLPLLTPRPGEPIEPERVPSPSPWWRAATAR